MIDGTVIHSPDTEGEGGSSRDRCPECSARLVHRDGCIACTVCGYSTCG